MPWGDGTGPWWAGTGFGRGWKGRGFGRGYGWPRGYCWYYYQQTGQFPAWSSWNYRSGQVGAQTRTQNVQANISQLEAMKQSLEEQLKTLEEQIRELKSSVKGD